MKKVWHTGKVLKGDKVGRTIGFPTINLSPAILPKDFKEGVYAALVRLDKKHHKSTLFFGPRLVKGETHPVLEIFIHEFEKEIYGKDIEFAVQSFIRDVRDFANLDALQKEIEKDIKASKKALKRLVLDK